MDIEESSVPYRAFLRSGSYPAFSQRVVRSGGVLVRAAGWFALIVTAASAGYNMTQRLVKPTPAAASTSAHGRALQPRLASDVPRLEPVRGLGRVEDVVERDAIAIADPGGQRSGAFAPTNRERAATGPASPLAAQRKRPGALSQPASFAATASVVEPASDRTAEQVSVIPDGQLQAAAGSEIPPAEPSEPRRERAITAPGSVPARDGRTSALTSNQAPRAVATRSAASLPLTATATLDSLVVRGPLSAAHVRRSLERVRPTLSDCYAEAARRAGFNRFAAVRVVVTIDEAGRVKTLPKVEGAQLPGLGTCLSSALSKLVCQAPDTGTARASIVLGFEPQR